MFNSVALEVVIGLVFIYLLYSLLATTVQELIANWLKLRAKMLAKGIKRMLDDGGAPKFSVEFYNHPLIKYFSREIGSFEKRIRGSSSTLPSYITAQNFSKVLTEKITQHGSGDDALSKIRNFISEQESHITGMTGKAKIEKDTLELLKSFFNEANNDVEKFKLLLEQWFDNMMDRVSGWYKRKAQVMLLIIGLAIALVFNVDTLKIVKKLSHDKDAAKALSGMASNYMKANPTSPKQAGEKTAGSTDSTSKNDLYTIDSTSKDLVAKADSLLHGEIEDANKILALGYSRNPFSCDNFRLGEMAWWKFIFLKILGWIITALAISLGAPFWFDLLNKLMKLRGAVKEETENSKPVPKKETLIPITVNSQNGEEAIG
jgi:hypothetical protein